MEKEIGKITKNDTTEIVIRVDDFGGRKGLTIREFVTGERYTGFTKAGVRISAENFLKFKDIINLVDEGDLTSPVTSEDSEESDSAGPKSEPKSRSSGKGKEDFPDY
jgi:hypothetical protein